MTLDGKIVDGKLIDIPKDEDVLERYVHYLASEEDPETRTLEFQAWLSQHDDKVWADARAQLRADESVNAKRVKFLDELIEETLDILETPPDLTQVLDTHGGRALWKAHVAAQAREHLAAGHKKSIEL